MDADDFVFKVSLRTLTFGILFFVFMSYAVVTDMPNMVVGVGPKFLYVVGLIVLVGSVVVSLLNDN